MSAVGVQTGGEHGLPGLNGPPVFYFVGMAELLAVGVADQNDKNA